MSKSSISNLVVLAFALAACLGCALFVHHYAVNGVWQDEWAFIPFLRDLQAGKLDLWQLFISQHNEHRLWFAVLILILTGNLCQYNGVDISEVGLAFMAITVAMMSVIVWRNTRSWKYGVFLVVPVIMVGFSLRQWENLICVCPFAPVCLPCFFVGTIMLLDGIEKSKFFWARLVSATVLAFGSTFCFANGVLAYPLGLLTLFLPNILSKEPVAKGTKLAGAVFGAAGFTTIASYALTFSGFGSNAATHLTLTRLFSHPLVYAKRLIICLATPLVGGPDQALPVGFLLAAILLCTVFLLIRNYRKIDRKIIVPLMLVLFGLASTLMVLYARAESPLIFFLSSHYATFLNLWVIGVYAILLGLISSGLEGADKKVALSSSGLLAILFIVCPLLSIKEGTETGEVIHTIRLVAANKLLNNEIQGDVSLFDECYSAKWVRYLSPYLEQNHLSIFSNLRSPAQLKNISSDNENIICHLETTGPSVDTTATTTHEGPPVINYPVAKVSGWIDDSHTHKKVKRVFVEVAPTKVYEAAFGLYRPDIVLNHNDNNLKRSGFSFVCDPKRALGSSKSIRVIAEDCCGHVFQLARTNYGPDQHGLSTGEPLHNF